MEKEEKRKGGNKPEKARESLAKLLGRVAR